MALRQQEGSTGLRDKKKLATKDALQRCALELFAERGFAAVSVDEIAQAADVSRSTFFRYFGSKEAVLFQEFDEAGDVFLKALRARPATETHWEAFQEAMIQTSVDRSTDERRDHNLAIDHLLRSDPALSGRRLAEQERWVEILSNSFAQRTGRNEPDFEDRLAATTCMAVSDRIGDEWRRSDSADVAETLRKAFAILRKL
jgi:AcrR family transcriptional regulator